MNHFLIDSEAIKDEYVFIEGNELNHLKNSLRLKAGDEITVGDGEGNKYLVELVAVSDRLARGEIKKQLTANFESEVKVTICQGLPKSKKMDLITQKSTELGIDKLIPVSMDHSIVKLKPSKAKRRVKRWQKIAREAAKQSRRARVPKVAKLINYQQALKLVNEYDLALIPCVEEKDKTLKSVLVNQSKSEIENIILFIGPEGGFSTQELKSAVDKGVIPVSFGPRTLRTETASIFAVGTLIYEFES